MLNLRTRKALEYLRLAVKKGFHNPDIVENKELDFIRGEKEFQDIIKSFSSE